MSAIVYCADFETHNQRGCKKTGVWALAMYPITNEDKISYDSDLWVLADEIDDFFEFIGAYNENLDIYFHNIKFDGSFLLDYILKHPDDWRYTENGSRMKKGEYQTLIDETGTFYSITLKYPKHKVRIMDSLKKIPLSIDMIAKSYCKDIHLEKGIIDYERDRTKDYNLADNPDEIKYLQTDVIIACKALKKHLLMGLDQMTIGSDALWSYKEMIYKKSHRRAVKNGYWKSNVNETFRGTFPCLDKLEPLSVDRLNSKTLEIKKEVMDYDSYIRRAYVGGWTYVNTHHKKYNSKLKELTVGSGCVFDVNSEHPYSMHSTLKHSKDRNHLMPFGKPKFGTGFYLDEVKDNKVYIQHCLIRYELKENGIPCIKSLGTSSWNSENQWSESSGEEIEERWFTNVDFDLILDNYNIRYIKFLDYLEFKASEGMFNSYIDYWINEKAQATIEKDAGRRQIAKLMLNNLYGKFGQKRSNNKKEGYLDEKTNSVKFETLKVDELRESCYTAVSVFVCAYSRDLIIRGAMRNLEHFCYADTDSLHLDCDSKEAIGLRVHDTDLGAFKLESEFCKARFLKSKCYIEVGKNDEVLDGFHHGIDTTKDEEMGDEVEDLNITVAGLLKSYAKKNPLGKITKADRKQLFKDCGLTFDNFHRGLIIKEGRNRIKRIDGGVILERGDFQIL